MHPRTLIAAAAATFMLLGGVGQPSAAQPSKSPSPFGRPTAPAKKTPAPSVAPKSVVQPQPAQPQQAQEARPPTEQTAAPEPAPLSPSADAACQAVTACFAQIAARRPYLAVDEHFDPEGFARRVLGKNFDKLDGAQRVYFIELSNVMFKSLVSGADFSAALVAGQHPQLSASELDGDVLVSFVTPTPPEGQRRHTLVLHQTSGGWRIVDIDTVAQRASDAFRIAAFDPAATTFAMEALVGGVIHSKIARLDDSPTQRNESGQREALAASLRAQRKSLMNQIELYKARNGQYPDLAAHGWDDLISGGYIRKAPVNPVNQSSKICVGLRGKPGYGWSWNPSTGDLGATYFDEQTLALTPDSP
jgi:hypothetical protein